MERRRGGDPGCLWERAKECRAYDPEGAVLMAQRLLEQGRRHIVGAEGPIPDLTALFV